MASGRTSMAGANRSSSTYASSSGPTTTDAWAGAIRSQASSFLQAVTIVPCHRRFFHTLFIFVSLESLHTAAPSPGRRSMRTVIAALKSFEQHLDDTPFTKTQRKVWILSAMGVLLDGLDFFIIG